MKQSKQQQQQCPYLSTIKKHLLDFDFQKVCCISLSTNNVYGCLVCGRYFQGRISSSPAYEHSIQYNHQMFINLSTSKIYCLPDNYQVESHTLNDIKFNLLPTYTKEDLFKLDQNDLKYNIDGKQYYPGVIGMNNLTKTDYANSIFQILNSIKEFRQFFLLKQYKQLNQENSIVQKLSLFIKKIWNPKSFKGAISPHQLLQCISQKSNKIFKIGQQSDPVKFLIWLLDNLNKQLKRQKNKFQPISLFQGILKTSFIKGIKNSAEYQQIPTKIQQKNFIILQLQFPQRGIFNKVQNEVEIKSLLQNYTGIKGSKINDGLRFVKVINYPQYLIIVLKRFVNNGYLIQKDTSQLNYSQQLQINQNQRYRLIAQVCHQGTVQNGQYRAYVQRGQKWFSALDLQINEVLKKQMLLGQPYIQIYKQIK